MQSPGTRIIFPWDKPTFTEDDKRMLEPIIPRVGVMKIGLEAMNGFLPDRPGTAATALLKHIDHYFGDTQIMWDQKVLDILTTIKGAVRGAAHQKFWGITVHASSGVAGLQAAIEVRDTTMIIGVTVLTDYNDERCDEVYNVNVATKLRQFAQTIAEAKCQAVVCAPNDLERIRETSWIDRALASQELLAITPGVRPAFASHNDQVRVMSPRDAIRAGAHYLVIGRPISSTPGISPADAISRIEDEIASA